MPTSKRLLPALSAHSSVVLAATLFVGSSVGRGAIDRDQNQQSDIWQLRYGTGNLVPGADEDGDGFSNLAEAVAGTNPRDIRSAPTLGVESVSGGGVQLQWLSQVGKRYDAQLSTALGTGAVWASVGSLPGDGAERQLWLDPSGASTGFFRLTVADVDTDGDGLTDWDEIQLGLDRKRANTDGFGSASNTDYTRVNTALGATNTVTVAALDPAMAENWPDPGVVAVRRTGNLDPITVNFSLSGTATEGADYTGPGGRTVTLGLGVSEVWLSFLPRADTVSEAAETISVTVASGSGYVVGSPASAALVLTNTPAGAVSEKEAARFLVQATFGPNPTDLQRVQQLGIAGWLDEQFARAPQLHLPLVQQWQTEIAAATPGSNASSTERTEAWWRRALQSDGAADPLRQRVAHALSQILVISDRSSLLESTPRGMADYHDLLLTQAFGSFRTLLRDVSLHPTMGLYLSHLRNQKADPARNRYPDENYAREVMQLFSIGLWELQSDGSRKLDGAGLPIPTYDNTTIANVARVFTGLSYAQKFTSGTDQTIIPATGFYDSYGIAWAPMRGFDARHDLAAKPLLGGVTLPARTASNPDTGAATLADVEAAIDVLCNHANVGPFIGRQLIQRLVTSNPSPQYIARVSAVFANNGAGVRGDLRAVVRAILLDPEARDPARLAEAQHGMQREPYLRYVALVRALGGTTSDGRRRGFRNLDADFLQRAYSSPSVFNFYLPDFQPLGPLQDAGLFGPEFQITNALTGITSPNRFYSAATQTVFRLNPSGASEAGLDTVIDPAPWLADATNNPENLVARLDRLLAAGTLAPATLRQVVRAVRRLPDPLGTTDQAARTTRATDRFRMALYLVLISPEFSVLK